jgi:hypothetical protein
MLMSSEVSQEDAFDRMIVSVPLMNCFKNTPPPPMYTPNSPAINVRSTSDNRSASMGADSQAVASPPVPSKKQAQVNDSLAFHAEQEAAALAREEAAAKAQAHTQAASRDSEGSFDGGV